MNKIESIITLARRYCIDNSNYWAKRYTKERTGKDLPYSYTDKDYDLFPRYNALSAILSGIELIVGKKYESLEECKKEIINLGYTSKSIFTSDINNQIEESSIHEERDKFAEYIDTITEEELQNVQPLPYKRRLTEKESEILRSELNSRWNFDGGYWFPLIELKLKHAVFLNENFVTEKDYNLILNFITRTPDKTMYMFTEESSDYEIECREFIPNSQETVFTDKNLNWIIYISHEGTISFGGEFLVEEVLKIFKKRNNLLNVW